jgi:hypothetical protein
MLWERVGGGEEAWASGRSGLFIRLVTARAIDMSVDWVPINRNSAKAPDIPVERTGLLGGLTLFGFRARQGAGVVTDK